MSGNPSKSRARSFKIGKRERVYQGEKDMSQKMKYLDVSFVLLRFYYSFIPQYIKTAY